MKGRVRVAGRIVLLLVALPLAAFAHDADILYVQAQSAPDGGLIEVITLTAASLGLLAPVDADGDGELTQADLDARRAAISAGVWDEMPLLAQGQPCTRGRELAALREGYVELGAELVCGPGELRQTFRFLSILPANYRVVLGSQLDGERGRSSAQGSFGTVTVPRPAPAGAWSPARFSLGFDDGLRRAFGLDALALFLLVGFARESARLAALRLALALAALAAGSFVDVPDLASALMFALGCVVVAARPRGVTALAGAALGCLGAGARDGGGPWPTALGLFLGSAIVAIGVFPVAWAVGRIAARRPRAASLLPWLLAVAAVVSRSVCFV